MLWVLGGGSAVLGVRGVLPVGLGAAPCMEGGGARKEVFAPLLPCRGGRAGDDPRDVLGLREGEPQEHPLLWAQGVGVRWGAGRKGSGSTWGCEGEEGWEKVL